MGQLAGSGLQRRFADGRSIRLGLRERAICASARPDYFPLVIERLVDNPRGTDPRPVRTIVGGIVPRGVRSVSLTVSGARRAVPVDARTRSFLAVLPGTVRRADLALVLGYSRGRERELDFGRGDTGDLEPGSVRTEVTAQDPTGGPALGLVSYRERGSGGDIERCIEPGRSIGGEIGAYRARFGSFLDSPSLISLAGFQDTWAPIAPLAGPIGSCTIGSGPVDAFGVKRMSTRLAVVHGILSRRVASLTVRGVRTRPSKPAIAAAGGAFIVPVISLGRLGERVVVSVRLKNGRTRSGSVPLAPYDRATTWDRWTPLAGGRILRIDWTGGFEPYSGVQVSQGRKVRVRVFERQLPPFAPDGTPYGIPDIAISRCVLIRLPRPLGNRRVIDATAQRPRPSGLPAVLRARGCAKGRPVRELSPAASPRLPAGSR